MKTTTCHVLRNGVTHHIPVLDIGDKCYFCGNDVTLDYVNACVESKAPLAPFFWSAKCTACIARYGAIKRRDVMESMPHIEALVFRSTLSTTCGSDDLPDYVMAGTTRVRDWPRCLVCNAKTTYLLPQHDIEPVQCKCSTTEHTVGGTKVTFTESAPAETGSVVAGGGTAGGSGGAGGGVARIVAPLIGTPTRPVEGVTSVQGYDPSTRNDAAYNHPLHYGGDTTYEAIKVIDAWGLGFALGNTVKYIARAGLKDPKKLVEDLQKAKWYLDQAIEHAKKGECRVIRVDLEDVVLPSPPERVG